jgi:secreted protein with Ig-like and vWFA domain
MSQNHDRHDDLTAEERTAAFLTAHALGQLDAGDRAEAERLLAAADAADARRHVSETARLASALTAARDDELPPRSADLRRAVLAAATRATSDITSAEAEPAARWGGAIRWLIGLGAIAVAVLVAVGIVPLPRRPTVEVVRLDTAGDTSKEKPEPAPTPTGETLPAQTAVPESKPTRSDVTALGRAEKNTRDDRPESEAAEDLVATIGPVRGKSYGLGGRAVAPHPTGDKQALQATEEGDLGLANGLAAAKPATPSVPPPVSSPTPGIMFFDDGREKTVEGLKRQEESASALRDLQRRDAAGERYNHFAENAFLRPSERPLSTFSIDVDTASYANVRRFLMAGQRPPRDAVRIEELLNYFRYTDPAPTGDVPFSVTVEAATCPWRPGHRIVRVGLKGRDVARDRRPAGNLVFLVDVSGSMGDADKLPLVKQALTMLVDELTENDRVAIVTYAGEAGLRLPSTSGDQKEKIRAAIDSLSSGGSTHGSAGIELAYEQAAERFIPGGANRVILATDGDLNVGITDDAALVDLITKKAKGGTFLTVLGFGQGNLQDEKMEKLADKGNGVYAYIDGVREARKVLVEQLTGSTLTIAKDVKIQVEFNPAQVASYRLLGYENRALADKDFRDDTKDAGEIGAGHGVTALYEIEVVGEADDRAPAGAEPLKYQPEPAPKPAPPADANASRELLTVKLRYKEPEGTTSKLLEVPLGDDPTSFDDATSDLRFASAVAAFGMLLRESSHAGNATFPMVAKIAAAALGGDEGGYRAEFLDLVRRAEATR